MISETKLRLIRKGKVNVGIRKEYRDKEKAIFNLYDRFISNDIIWIEYLKKQWNVYLAKHNFLSNYISH